MNATSQSAVATSDQEDAMRTPNMNTRIRALRQTAMAPYACDEVLFTDGDQITGGQIIDTAWNLYLTFTINRDLVVGGAWVQITSGWQPLPGDDEQG